MKLLKHTAFFFATCILTPLYMGFCVIECLAEQAENLIEHAQKSVKNTLHHED